MTPHVGIMAVSLSLTAFLCSMLLAFLHVHCTFLSLVLAVCCYSGVLLPNVYGHCECWCSPRSDFPTCTPQLYWLDCIDHESVHMFSILLFLLARPEGVGSALPPPPVLSAWIYIYIIVQVAWGLYWAGSCRLVSPSILSLIDTMTGESLKYDCSHTRIRFNTTS